MELEHNEHFAYDPFTGFPRLLESPGARFTKNLTTNLGKPRIKCDLGKS